MRPFYRKDLFREDILKVMPIEHKVKLESDEMRFETVKMEKGQSITLDSDGYEIGLVILTGVATVEMEGFVAKDLGERSDVFSGKPSAVYIPIRTKFNIKATGYGTLEIALCKVKSEFSGQPYCIMSEEITAKQQGVLNWKRKLHEIFIGDKQNSKSRLVVGETYGCPGPWATYPYNHKEDKAIFYFKLSTNPNKSIQVMRDLEKQDAYYVQDGSTLLVQNAYIPVPEAEGTQVYYLWFKITA